MRLLLPRSILKPLLKPIYDDMRQMELLIRASGLVWTIVQPSRRVDGAHRPLLSGRVRRASLG